MTIKTLLLLSLILAITHALECDYKFDPIDTNGKVITYRAFLNDTSEYTLIMHPCNSKYDTEPKYNLKFNNFGLTENIYFFERMCPTLVKECFLNFVQNANVTITHIINNTTKQEIGHKISNWDRDSFFLFSIFITFLITSVIYVCGIIGCCRMFYIDMKN